MTVEELIEELEGFDPEAEVCICASAEDIILHINDIHQTDDTVVIGD